MSVFSRPMAHENRARVLLITGGYYPAPGGASNYSHTLAHLLTEHGMAEAVEVFTERYPGASDEEHGASPSVVVRREMPWRATRDIKGIMSLFLYAFQLAQISMEILTASRRFDVVVVHSSLIYRTGLLARVVGLAKRRLKAGRTRYYLDVRDPLMPAGRVRFAKRFDGVVACSRNVVQDLVVKGAPRYLIREIPIPLSPHVQKQAADVAVCTDFGLKLKDYVFVAHGMTPGKRTEEVIEAVGWLRQQGESILLAVAGRARYWPAIASRAQEAGWLHFLGRLPNDRVRALMAECGIHVNVCTEEGLPRGSLEALSAGALTVLPPNVPEFDQWCPEWIGTAGNPRRLAEEIKGILRRNEVAPYPLDRHHPGAVALKYGDFFKVRCPVF